MTKKIEEIIESARRLGIADETKIRNLKIKTEFDSLRACGMKAKEAISKLADDFFLGYKSTEEIIYKRK